MNELAHYKKNFYITFKKGIAVFRYCHKTGISQKHDHDFFEIVYCLSGEAQHVIRNGANEFSKGMLLMINTGEMHYFNVKKELNIYNLLVHRSALNVISTLLPPVNFLKHTKLYRFMKGHNGGYCCITFSAADAVTVKNCIEEMILLSSCSYYNHRKLLSVLFSAFLHRLCIISEKYHLPHGDRFSEKIKKVIDFIHAHYSESVNLTLCAEIAECNASYLSRIFAAATGYTVTEYINEYRVSRACHVLATTDESVLSAALTAGFINISFFNRVFRKVTGMTPRQFRAGLDTYSDKSLPASIRTH